ncbi:GntR family transcriptional regulator [Brevibacillus reuszeri]|uniref:Transcriptional regulator n=1 Tax=Brevibacillus reuszeri TaxID=54915 RepID=A0A0K9YJP5_9BACL|nr:PLP-dependent aminotransferase family protein [Brevibacillus reuszeri]KNB68968.1 transcriptional regulator [Brevibacillus reuszeri]MED1859401.1 PLP-dependent aminotransferase family protein [Brevibacillus reuszeri]GED71483.1 GntR family transcriptional regulator [Brevibacillus reuszeri]
MKELSAIRFTDQEPLFTQIYHFLKDEILSNQLPYEEFLPSIRSCARSLGVSKNTVEVAYQLLVSEGYVKSIPKKGYQVVYLAEAPSKQHDKRGAEPRLPDVRFDFRYGNIELGTFPFHQWNKLRNKVIAYHQQHYMVEGLSQGEYILRKELAKLLHEARGIICTPEQIIVGATPQQLVSLLTQILDRDRHFIGVENPGYDGARNTFLHGGYRVQGISLDVDGVSIKDLEKSGANAMYVSPSQQFIHKMTMSLEKRTELVKWLDSHAYLMEDDYEWEFKYQESYIPSIQSMAPQKVIYIGRLSKALLPLVNVSYMVLPYELLACFHQRVSEYDQPVSRLDQLTLSAYLSEGYWHKHVQYMRKNYAEKRKAFLQAISSYMPGQVEMEGKDTGLHAFLTVKRKCAEAELMELAYKRGVKVYGTARYWFRGVHEYPTVLLGYGALSQQDIQEGVRLLAEAWFG